MVRQDRNGGVLCCDADFNRVAAAGGEYVLAESADFGLDGIFALCIYSVYVGACKAEKRKKAGLMSGFFDGKIWY